MGMDAAAWDERYATREYVWDVGPNQFVEAHLADLPPGRALDLAAGECRNAVWLATLGWSVVAVDYSGVALDKGRRLAEDHGAQTVEFVRADVTVYEPDGDADLVLVSYLQLPTDERLAVLRRAAGFVAAGGTFFLIAHDASNVEHGHGGPSSPEVCYSVDESVAQLAGLDIAEARVVERTVEGPDGPHTALDTLIRATRPG